MSRFLSELKPSLLDDDKIWELDADLVYVSDLLGKIIVPSGFQTDFASVPKVPIVFMLFGNRAHRESVIHDYLYRVDSFPIATRQQADEVFYEAMALRGKSWFVRHGMWAGVRVGGWTAYHKLKVMDCLFKTSNLPKGVK